MAFEKQSDGYRHWEYTGRNNRQVIRKLWLCWLIVILSLFMIAGIIAAATGLPKDTAWMLMLIMSGIALFVSLIFLSIGLWERFAEKKYRYAINEQVLKVHTGRYRSLDLETVRSITACEERNAIILGTGRVSVEIFASDEDFKVIRSFLTEHCKGCEISG